MINKSYIVLDVEYNKEKEPLSLGITEKDMGSRELYFSNNVDKYSFGIHGLGYSFLKKEGVNYDSKADSIKENILSNDLIIGFDVSKDLQVLKLNKLGLLYMKEKVFDIKDLFDIVGYNVSLGKISNFFKIDSLFLKYLTPHTAIFDSLVTNEIFELILNTGRKHGIQEEDLINELTNLSNLKYNGYPWDLEDIKHKFNWFRDFLRDCEQTRKRKIKDSILDIDFTPSSYALFNDKFLLLNKDHDIIFKMRSDYVSLEEVHLPCFKIHDLEYEEFGFRFNKDFIKKNVFLIKGC